MAPLSFVKSMLGMAKTNQNPAVVPGLGLSLTGRQQQKSNSFDLLSPIRKWLDSWEIDNRYLARLISRLIPAQCPFERDLKLFGCTLLHIPPLCKLNPLYEEFVGLRFRALCFLADECGEDIRSFI